MATSSPSSFHAEAQFQRACAVCGATGPFEAHHIVSKQRLKKLGLRHLMNDPRNALRLCVGLDGSQCHGRYTLRSRGLKIKTSQLPLQARCFIWMALKMAGKNYLEREYTGVDRLYTLHEEGKCSLCQL